MTALRYIPGQIVVFGRSSLASSFDDSYLSAFAEIINSRHFELETGSYYLELFTVGNGEELRFLEYTKAQDGVITSSLNYIGMSLSGLYLDESDHLEASFPPGIPLPKTTKFLVQAPGSNEIQSYSLEERDSFVNVVKKRNPLRIIAAIDVQVEHCKDVMRSIKEGLVHRQNQDIQSRYNSANVAIIGLTSQIDRSEITDLDGFCSRLLYLAELSRNVATSVVAINLSVDFSQVIRGFKQIDAAQAESPDALFSLTFFESVLLPVITELSIANEPWIPRRPAVFAAAGNQLTKGEMRVRLGYPATRPETIATTFVQKHTSIESAVTPVAEIDVPATYGLKPCLAIDIDQTSVSNIKGSSLASAWLAGHYTTLLYEEKLEALGTLSKIAWLTKQTERRQVLPSGRKRLPCFAAIIKENNIQVRSNGEFDDLVSQLNGEFNADFCLHGSTVMVSEWLIQNECSLTQLAPWVHKDLGDIDLIFSGAIERTPVAGSKQIVDVEDIKTFTRQWLKTKINRSWVSASKRLVQIHPYEGTINAEARLRSVTPVTKLYLTGSGIIDTWGGLENLQKRSIQFLPMIHPLFWARNKLFRTGADSIALNILQWISPIVLLQLVSHAAGISGPMADSDSVLKIHNILDQTSELDQVASLFGYQLTDKRERLDRRFERVELLMGSSVRQGILDQTLEDILSRLQDMRLKLLEA